MISTGSGAARRQIIERPRSSSAVMPAHASGRVAGSVPSRWSGTRPPVSPNQKRDRPVSTRPLSGIGVGSTTSNAEMRSEATSSSRSSSSAYRSRTLPERRNEAGQPRGGLERASFGRGHQCVQPVQDGRGVLERQLVVEAGREQGRRERLAHLGSAASSSRKRPSLVGGAQRARAGRWRRRPRATGRPPRPARKDQPAGRVQAEAARDVLAHPLGPHDEPVHEARKRTSM